MNGKMKVLGDSFFLDEDGNLAFEMHVDRLEGHPNIDLVFMKPKSMLKNQDLKDCDIFFGIEGITRELLEGVESLKHVAKFGAGSENTDLRVSGLERDAD